MNKNRSIVMSLLVVILFASITLADIRLPAVISDNMVLQQQDKAAVWGWAGAGQTVKVKPSWKSKKQSVTAGKDGKWLVNIPTPKAGGPYKITVSDKDSRIVIANILIGEVWVCSGQSNMAWTVRSSNDADKEIAAAKYPNIRMFTVSRKVAETPQDDCQGDWQVCTPETAGNFSAVGYFFGRHLHKNLDVPIGLLHTSWGGTPAEAWTRREVLQANENFVPIVNRYDELVANHPKVMEAYNDKLEKWQETADKAKSEGKKAPGRPRPPRGPGNSHTPAGACTELNYPISGQTLIKHIAYFIKI